MLRAFPRLTTDAAFLAGLLLVAVAGFGGAFLGYAEDNDSLGVARSIAAIQAGGYERSRVYGVPLYELFAAGVFSLGGLLAVNLASTALTGGALAFLWATLNRVGGRAAPYALLAFAAHPLVLINSSVMMETALTELCVTAGLWAAVRAAALRSVASWALCGVICALGFATRPDSVLFALACGCVLAVREGMRSFGADRWRRPVIVLAMFAAPGLAAIGVYAALNGGLTFVSTVTVTADSGGRSLARAVLGAINAVGLLASLVALAMLARTLIDARQASSSAPPEEPQRVLAWIAAACVLLYGFRFLALPDELEYLLPAVIAVIALVGTRQATPLAQLFAVAVMSASLVQPALFVRDADGVRPVLPSLQRGALAQDWAYRRHNLWLRSASTLADLSLMAGLPGAAVDDRHLWLNGVAFLVDGAAGPGPDSVVVIGEDQLYRFEQATEDDPHWLGHYLAAHACTTVLVPRRGWRVLQAPNLPEPPPERPGELCAPIPVTR